jgi:hypothetical protein
LEILSTRAFESPVGIPASPVETGSVTLKEKTDGFVRNVFVPSGQEEGEGKG